MKKSLRFFVLLALAAALLTVSAFMLGAVVLFNWFVWRYLIFG